jgi:hypothetical protein
MKKQDVAHRIPHFSSVSLRNFRGFKKVDSIPFAPLTFLVGPNSSGKSSIFGALLLLAQSGFSVDAPIAQTPSWAGPLIDLGSYNDAVFRHNARLNIEIGVKAPLGPLHYRRRPGSKRGSETRLIGITFRLRTAGEDPIGRLSRVRLTDLTSGEEITFRYTTSGVFMEFLGRKVQRSWKQAFKGPRFESWMPAEINAALKEHPHLFAGKKSAYHRMLRFLMSPGILWLLRASERVSSGRAAPRRWYPVTGIRFYPDRDFFAPRVFNAVDPTMLGESKGEWPYYWYQKRAKIRPRQRLASVLRELEIASTITDSKLSPYHSAITVKDSVTDIISNLMDVGYGTSQVIPVLHACLSDAPSPLFVEQPEIHLHPQAQANVAELLCKASLSRQVVVETHSAFAYGFLFLSQ